RMARRRTGMGDQAPVNDFSHQIGRKGENVFVGRGLDRWIGHDAWILSYQSSAGCHFADDCKADRMISSLLLPSTGTFRTRLLASCGLNPRAINALTASSAGLAVGIGKAPAPAPAPAPGR